MPPVANPSRRRAFIAVGGAVVLACGVPGVAIGASSEVRAAFDAAAAGRAVVVMRHALAPGTGDPASLTLGDCATQRNLSEAGRAQARRIGVRLAELLGTDRASVHSSEWCRCVDTARLLGLGEVSPLPALNSFFGDRENGPAQTRQLREWIGSRIEARDGPVVLVTHQVNVTALTGVYPASGEMVVYGRTGEDGEPGVLARLAVEP